MKKKNLEKWNKIINKGKLNYVIKYGVLVWGIPVGLIVNIWRYIDEKPLDFTQFIFESLPTLIVFPIAGIFFGLFMFNYIKNKIC